MVIHLHEPISLLAAQAVVICFYQRQHYTQHPAHKYGLRAANIQQTSRLKNDTCRQQQCLLYSYVPNNAA